MNNKLYDILLYTVVHLFNKYLVDRRSKLLTRIFSLYWLIEYKVNSIKHVYLFN